MSAALADIAEALAAETARARTALEGPPRRLCQMVEVRADGSAFVLAARLVPCPVAAAFEVITRCQSEGARSPTNVRLMCLEHEQLAREHPEMSRCDRGHLSVIVAVYPLRGGVG